MFNLGMALFMGELFVVWCCWVDLSLLDINQVLMEMEVRRPQNFYYKQLSVLVVLFWRLLLGWF